MRKILFIMLLPVIAIGQGFRTTLKGTVTGHGSDSIAVYFMEDDSRSMPPRYIIHVENGRFEQTIEGDAMRMMKITFVGDLATGGGRFWLFFPDAEVVEMTLGAEHEDDIVKGGKLNRQLRAMREEMYKEFQKSRVEIPEQKALVKKMDGFADAGKRVSDPEVRPVFDRLMQINDSLRQIGVESMFRMLDKTDGGLVPYSIFVQRIYYYKEYTTDLKLLERLQTKFAQANPGHPYNELVLDVVNAIKMTRFVDFTVPDLGGEMHTLSEEIGKIALIDLWASWCGPCIRASREMLPIYNDYRDKGFTVVGVARESNDTKALEMVLAREKFPWLTLVEMNDGERIWAKYGAANAGGIMVLVDKTGAVVKKNPTADEVREYLRSNL